jgi:hypothetical protein
MCNLQPTSGQDRNSLADLDSQLQEQERIINISYALASEASQRSKQVAGKAMGVSLLGLVPALCSLGLNSAWPIPELGSQWKFAIEGHWCVLSPTGVLSQEREVLLFNFRFFRLLSQGARAKVPFLITKPKPLFTMSEGPVPENRVQEVRLCLANWKEYHHGGGAYAC